MITNGLLNLSALLLGGYILLHAGNETPPLAPTTSPIHQEHCHDTTPDQRTVRKVVIFDIGGVLASYSSSQVGTTIFKQVARDVGFFKALKYTASQKKLTNHLRSLIFQILEEMTGGVSPERWQSLQIYDEEGNPHAKGLCLLQAGLISSEEFTRTALSIINKWWDEDKLYCKKERKHFSCIAELSFVSNTIIAMSNGALIASIFKPIKEGLVLLKRLVNTPGVRVLVLSNYPPDQFAWLLKVPFLQKAFEKIPREHIFCSGQKLPAEPEYSLGERLLHPKPAPAAFEEMVHFCKKTFGVAPSDIIFIDNQWENIATACQQGIKGMHVNAVATHPTVPAYTFQQLSVNLQKELLLPQQTHGITHGATNALNVSPIIIEGEAEAY